MKIKMLNTTLLGMSLLLGSTATHSANLNVVAGAKADLVESLPKYGKPKSAHYSGYLAVQSALPASTAEQIYYYLATAQNDVKDNAPVILWLNGGPGSSSFYGFFTENGPYTIQADAGLKENPFAWNKHSNRTYALTGIHNCAYVMPVMSLCFINSAIILLNNCRCT